MPSGTLEILASILIVFVMIKLIVILISPQAWLNFAKSLYVNPAITQGIAFILAAIVLYFLHSAGVTIVQILAVALFVSLILMIGLARYANQLIDWVMAKDLNTILKEHIFYTLIWVGLLLWGIHAIFIA